jgi:hypothetical protein
MFKLVLLIINNTKPKCHSVNTSLYVYVVPICLNDFRFNTHQRNNQVTGNHLSIAGNDLPVAGNNITVAGNNLSVAGNDLSVSGNDLPVAGNNLSIAGNDLPITGKHLSLAGNFKISISKNIVFNY